MAFMAGFIIAISFAQPQLEPSIDWVFSADACELCSQAQMEILAKYGRNGDRVILNFPGRNKAVAKSLRRQWEALGLDLLVEEQDTRFEEIATGWVLRDPITHEKVTYQAANAKYSVIRAQTLLEVFRDPSGK